MGGRTNCIFYDTTSFENQAKAEAARIPVDTEIQKIVKTDSNHYSYSINVATEEKTVLIPVTTESEFIDGWNAMEDATDVTLIFHGSAKTLNFDAANNEYLTTNPDGKTPKGNPAFYIGALDSKEIGTLKIYSCQGGNVKESDNVAKCFMQNNSIKNVYASDGKLSFTRKTYEPKIPNKGYRGYIQKYGQKPQGLIEIK